MIIDPEKSALPQLQLHHHQPPPPPYIRTNAPPPFPHSRPPMTLCTLPAHILLQIVHMTFPQTPDYNEGSKLERQRKTLYWLSMGLRLVNRSLYIACMHVLRSTYLSAYDSLIRAPYSSDPFPLPSSPHSQFAATPDLRLGTIQRETATLDLFIAVKVCEDSWADDTEFHLERDESFRDLFDHNQPRSRLEDLVRIYGVHDGVVSVDDGTCLSVPGHGNMSPSPTSGVFRIPSPQPQTPLTPLRASAVAKGKQPAHRLRPQPIPFSSLSVSFSSRHVGLLLGAPGKSYGKRTIVETERSREEPLEAAARRLVRDLGVWLETS
ncbi:hypothetical protein MKEN_01485600 [Mycena kentingensis (nom. inval.)]|nr:hypothetical protein MKEN_01485600 [Mycena kentingensis (nom. inval.)]